MRGGSAVSVHSKSRAPLHAGLTGLGLLLAFLAPPARGQAVDLSGLPAHPRVFLRPSLLPQLRAERQVGQPKYDMYTEIKRRADGYLDDALSGSYLPILNLALVGWVEDNLVYTNRAVQELMYKMRQGSWPADMVEYSIAYDWLYPHMSAAQRDTVRAAVYDAFPNPPGQRTVYYNLEANEATYRGLAGLVCYGDGGTAQQNARFQAMVDQWDGRMRGVREYAWPNGTATSKGGVLPTREFYFPDGGYYKGNQYLQKEMQGTVTYLALFSDLGLGDYWNEYAGFIDNLPEYLLRIRRPDYLASRIMMGSGYGYDSRGLEAIAHIATARSQPLAHWILSDYPWDNRQGVEWYLIYVAWRPSTPTLTPSSLPLVRFYGQNGGRPNSGTSWAERIVTRTGWSHPANADCDDVYFMLTAGDYFGDYYNFFEPTFEIYYRGALAIRSGWYTSQPANPNYYSCAVSCNTLVVFDSTQTAPRDRWGLDYLYESPGRPRSIYDVRDYPEKYDVSEISRFDPELRTLAGPVVAYARAELTPGTGYYSSNASRKVETLMREFMWTGRHFVIWDSVVVQPSAMRPKSLRWLLHTINEPVVSGTPLYSVVPDHIVVYPLGSYKATRVGTVGALVYDGAITVQPLRPESAILRKVGGDGYQCWVDAGWTSGTNYPPANPSMYSDANEVGAWRMETIVPAAVPSAVFLHYIYVGRPGETAPQAAVQVTDGRPGCVVPGVGVFLQASPAGIRYDHQGNLEPCPHYVGGLEPHLAYDVRFDGRRIESHPAGSAGALAFTTVGSGRIEILPASLARGDPR